MPSPILSERGRLDMCVRCGFRTFFATLLFFSLHWALVLYINSSFLAQFFNTHVISILYIVGSLITMCGFFIIPIILNHLGSVRLITVLTCIEMLSLLSMATAHNQTYILFSFLTHLSITPLILFSMDTLMEKMIGSDESTTGSKRGIFLTIASGSLALSALGMGFLVGDSVPHFTYVYFVATGLLIPFLVGLHYNFGAYQDPQNSTYKAIEGIRAFWHAKDIRNVFFANLLLQFYFAWMVIYTPVYLAREMGFNWEHIGIILFSGLIAYVFLEYAIGYLADTFFGEKEMMAIGFVLIMLSTSSFILLSGNTLALWMMAMFMTRVGAALVETTTESYFFKQTRGSDVRFVGIFRIAQPLGYILCPVVGGILLFILPFSLTFVVLGILLTFGLFFSMALHDTK